MSRFQLGTVIVLVSALSLSMRVLAQAERLSDDDVKGLINQVVEWGDKFEGNLDSKLKNSTVRGLNGAINVSHLLQDYEDNAKKLQNRFTDDNAASLEVAVLLKQAGAIDKFMQGTSSVMKGRKEWDAEAASLKHLAEAYGATFPLAEGATVSRMNDKETAAAADAISEAADRLKKDIDNATTLSLPDKNAGKKDLQLLIDLADAVEDHTKDGKPATNEARQLVEQAAKVQTFIGAHKISTANWQTIQTSLGSVRQAFSLAE